MAVNVKGSGGKVNKENPNVKTFYSSDYPLSGQSQQTDMSLISQEIIEQDINIASEYKKIIRNGFYTIQVYDNYLNIIEFNGGRQEYNKTWNIFPPDILYSKTSVTINDNTFQNCQLIIKNPDTLLMIVDYYNKVYENIQYPGYGESGHTSGCVIYRCNIYDGNWVVAGKYSNFYITGAAAAVNENADISIIDIEASTNFICILSNRTTQQNEFGDKDVKSYSNVYICDIFQHLVVNDISNEAQDVNHLPSSSFLNLSLDNDFGTCPIDPSSFNLIINNDIYYFHISDREYQKCNINNQTISSILGSLGATYYVLRNSEIFRLDIINQDNNNYLITISKAEGDYSVVFRTSIIGNQIIPIFNINDYKELKGILYTNDEKIYLIDLEMDKTIDISSLDLDITQSIALFHQYTDITYNPYQNIIGYLLYQNSDGVQKKAMYCQNLLLSD